jgi:hypothetical protein
MTERLHNSPIAGEIRFINDLTLKKRENYPKNTLRTKIVSYGLATSSLFVGGVVTLEGKEMMFQDQLEVIGLFTLGVIGIMISRFRRKAFKEANINS